MKTEDSGLGALAGLLEPREQAADQSGRMTDFHKPGDGSLPFFHDGELLAERFRIVRFVGRGGMGEVYEAEDVHLGRVALKTIRPELSTDEQHLRRFRQEVELARKITDPHVCRIHDFFVLASGGGSGAVHFLTMEFLEGVTLAQRIHDGGPLPVDEAASIASQLCSGLQAVHEAGVVHRDLKSNNVMLVERHGATRAVLMDLGLARASVQAAANQSAEPTQTMTGAVIGTPEYMAPEQFRGASVSPATDVYALGIVLYEMMTGDRPFRAASPLGAAVMRAKPPTSVTSIRPEVPRQWDTVIQRCLAYEPEERFPSATDVATALAGKAPRIAIRRRTVMEILAVAVLSVLAVLGWIYRQTRPGPVEQRVAVLAFENIGGDPANQALCDGLAETVSGKLTELEQFQGSLSVVPASEVRKNNVVTARDARREFAVNLVVMGSVQRSAAGMRLIINLVDALRLKQLGSHNVFVPATDPTFLQEGVIVQITDLLNIQLRPEARRRLAQGSTPVPGAYDYYVQGAGYLAGSPRDVDEAITEFLHALDRDPNYALAHAGLGEAYWYKYQATKEPPWIDEAVRHCQEATRLQPQLAAAHVTMAMIASGRGKYRDAIHEAQKAIVFDPGNDRGYAELARALAATNQPALAEETWKRAIALRRGYWINYVQLGTFYCNQGRYAEAIEPFTRVTELVPDSPTGYTNLGGAYHMLGREQEAEQFLKKSIELRRTPLALANLGTVYFFQRRYAEAVPIYEMLAAEGTRDYRVWGNLGDVYRWAPGNAPKAANAYGRATELATRALSINPHNATALASRGLYRAKTGQSAQALDDMNSALRYASGDKNILFQAAITCEVLGRRARALALLKSAVDGGYSISEINAEPELEKLRQDRSWQAILSSKPQAQGEH